MNIYLFAQRILTAFLLFTSCAWAAYIERTAGEWYNSAYRSYLWGYKGNITAPTRIRDLNELTLYAQAAAAEMMDYFEQDWEPRGFIAPGALTAFTADRRRVYFASSVKGGGQTSFPNFGRIIGMVSEVSDALFNCQRFYRVTHNNEGRCGEIMAINNWLIDNPGAQLSNYPGALIVTVVTRSGYNTIAPCLNSHEGKVWGCDQFLGEIGFTSTSQIGGGCQSLSRRSLELEARAAKGQTCPLLPKSGKKPAPGSKKPQQNIPTKPTKPGNGSGVVPKPNQKQPKVPAPVVKPPATGGGKKPTTKSTKSTKTSKKIPALRFRRIVRFN